MTHDEDQALRRFKIRMAKALLGAHSRRVEQDGEPAKVYEIGEEMRVGEEYLLLSEMPQDGDTKGL